MNLEGAGFPLPRDNFSKTRNNGEFQISRIIRETQDNQSLLNLLNSLKFQTLRANSIKTQNYTKMNMRMKRIVMTILVSLAFLPAIKAQGYDIATIAKSDPLVITGAVGTQNTYYYSSLGSGYASPLSSSAYANLNISVYGIAMPFSFYYSSDNLSFSHPQFSFNVSPTYKGWTLHLGRRSMAFSNYIYNIPFNGIGLEYTKPGGNGLRFGAFYGVLRNAVNYNPDEVSAATPAYRRTGWGLKVGYGSSRNFIDLYLFRAQDHRSSIDEVWYDKLNAQENIVLGMRGRWQIIKQMALSANVAASVFSNDITAPMVDSEKVKELDGIFDVRYSSLLRWAGDVSLTTNLNFLSFALNYKLVQPDYTTLGVSYMSNNYHSMGASANTRIGKLVLGGNFSFQSDNLSNEQLYTTRGYVYGANASLPVGSKINLSANYNGYLQRQYDGSAIVNDTTRINRVMNSFTFTPTYNTSTTNFNHGVSLSANYSENKDLNKFNGGKSDVTTMAIGANYSMTVIPIETNFGFNYSHQNSDGYESKYVTNVYSLSASKSLLKDRNLSLSASMSLVQNKMNEDSNISFGGSLSAGYTLADVHNFSLSANYNKFSSTNLVADEYRRDGGFDFSCSVSYAYSFTAFSIKRNKDKAGKKYELYSDFSRTARRERAMKAHQEKANQENRKKANSVKLN